MAISPLISTVIGFLSPALPYLVKLGEKTVEETAPKLIGQAAWDKAKDLWEKIRPKVEAKAAGQEAIQNVVAMPDDVDAQAALRVQLKKLLLEDPALLEELQPMAKEVELIMSAKRGSTIKSSTQTARNSEHVREVMDAEDNSVIEDSKQEA